MVLKDDFTTEGDVTAEVVPLFQAETERLLESLYSCQRYICNRSRMLWAYSVQRCHTLKISLCGLKRSPCSINLGRHLLYRRALSVTYE
jgi:hypothetical protein